ncbi:MAG: hypothetical protein JO316_26820 [Abitibacteriaceae bacterium]|nr:hypothetical protein [Abditibacteriaceae bacterium]
MNPRLVTHFRRATLTAVLLCPALIAANAPAPVWAQTAAPSNPPPANDAATPTSPLADIRLPEGAFAVTTPSFVTAYTNLLNTIAHKNNLQATGTEAWGWLDPATKPDEAADIMDAVARKLRRADYTYTPATPQKTETATITLFTAKSADKSLLGAWRLGKQGLFLGWCILKPTAGGGAATTTPTQPNTPPQTGSTAQTAPAGQTTPKEDAFTRVSRVTSFVIPGNPDRIDNEDSRKIFTKMLQKAAGETQVVGDVEAMGWRGPAIDEVTAPGNVKEVVAALQKAGYTYRDSAPQAGPNGITYTYFTTTGGPKNLEGMWRFSPGEHSLMLAWAPTTPAGAGGVAQGVPSALTGIALPNDAVAVPTESLVNALTTLLQRAAAADQKKVTNVEVFAWKGDAYKPDQADAIKGAVMERLQKLGFIAEASAPNDGAAITYFRAHSGAKAIQGLWRKSDTMLILAWGELTAG